MSKHTPEPWALLDNRNVEGVIVGGQNKEMHTGNSSPSQIATTSQQEWMEPGERLKNSRRIVACVNACAGFTTEDLEAHTGPRRLHTRLKYAFCKIDGLLSERSATGLAIDAAIRDGVVPEQHPLRSRLEMLANHRQREQELLAALERLLPWAETMGGMNPDMKYTGDHPLAISRAAIAKAKGE